MVPGRLGLVPLAEVSMRSFSRRSRLRSRSKKSEQKEHINAFFSFSFSFLSRSLFSKSNALVVPA